MILWFWCGQIHFEGHLPIGRGGPWKSGLFWALKWQRARELEVLIVFHPPADSKTLHSTMLLGIPFQCEGKTSNLTTFGLDILPSSTWTRSLSFHCEDKESYFTTFGLDILPCSTRTSSISFQCEDKTSDLILQHLGSISYLPARGLEVFLSTEEKSYFWHLDSIPYLQVHGLEVFPSNARTRGLILQHLNSKFYLPARGLKIFPSNARTRRLNLQHLDSISYLKHVDSKSFFLPTAEETYYFSTFRLDILPSSTWTRNRGWEGIWEPGGSWPYSWPHPASADE